MNKHSGRRWVVHPGGFLPSSWCHTAVRSSDRAWTESFLRLPMLTRCWWSRPVLLLIVDIVVPIPSSLVSTARIFLGFWRR